MRIRIVNRIDVSTALRDFCVDQINASIDDFLSSHLKKYCGSLDGITLLCDGVKIPKSIWNKFNLKNTKYLTFIIEPQGTGFSIAMLVIMLATAVYSYIMMRKLKTKGTDSGTNSSSIYDVNAQGNQIRLEDPIPEQFGLVKAFPDYASDKHYYYVNNERYMDVLLCQGIGSYNHSLDTMYIGSTPFSSYIGTDIDVLIAEPGEDISEHPAHKCWYNSTEIDSAGKEVKAKDNSAARARGDKQTTNITFATNTCTFSTGATFYAGDYIRIYNCTGYDYVCATTNTIDHLIDCSRIYVSEFPCDEDLMSYSVGYSAILKLTTNKGITLEYPVNIQNYGTHNEKGKFLDVSQISVDYDAITALTLTIKNWAFPGENIDSTHLSDNGIYKILSADSGTYQVMAYNKKGIAYVQDDTWASFASARTCTDCIVELLSSEQTNTATSNVAGYYRACPIGATSQYYEVDFDFPSGLYEMNSKGKYEDRTANILLEYRIAGSTDEPTKIYKTYTRASGDEFAETISIDVGNADYAYEFRVTNQSDYTEDTNVQQSFRWNGLKCLIAEKTSYDDVTMICLTVRGSSSLSELSNNQISTIWERRLSTLKDVSAIEQESEVVTGYNTYNYDSSKLYKLILASKTYPTNWDIDPDANDHSYAKNYVTTDGHILGYGDRWLIIKGEKQIYDDAGGWYGLIDSDKNGMNYPSTEFYCQFNFQYMLINATKQWQGHYACFFVFGIDNIDSLTRAQLAQGHFNSNNYGGVYSQGSTYAIQFKKDLTNASSTAMNYTTSVGMTTGIYPTVINIVRFTGSYNYNYEVIKSCEIPAHGITNTITIEKTLGYIRVTIEGKYASETTITTLSVDEDAPLQYCTGQYCGWWIGGYTIPSYWLAIRDFVYKIPTNQTIYKTAEASPASLNVDKEANRALAPAIKYICETSKFGSELYNATNLLSYDSYWRKKNYNFDFRFDTETTLLEAIQQIAQVGFAEPIVKGNAIHIVDKRKDASIVQMFTAGNMTGTPKITYNFLTPDDNNEIDCKYTSAETWKSDEIYVTIDSENVGSMTTYRQSSNDESVEILAVTDADKAYDLSLRRLREILFCRREIEFSTELDALNCQYGDLIAVAMPQDMSVFAGRVIGYDADNKILTLSDSLSSELGASILYVRRPNGTCQQVTAINNGDGTVTIAEKLDFTCDFSSVSTMPLYAIGEVTKWWVTSIKPSSNGSKCTVTATNYDTRVFGNSTTGYGLGEYGYQSYGE